MARTYNQIDELEIDEISAVDSPAQEGAKKKIIKVAIKKDKGENDMSKKQENKDIEKATETKKTNESSTSNTNDGEKKLESVEKKLDELTKENETLKAGTKLTGEQKEYFDSLKDDEKEEFIKAENKDEIIAKSKEEDKVIYTAKDGKEYRKSDGEEAIKNIKKYDELQEKVEKLEQEKSQDELEKRAEATFPNIKGSKKVKAILLKAIDDEKDEEIQKELKDTLKSCNDTIKNITSFVGSGGEESKGYTDAEKEYDEAVAKYMKDNNIKKKFEARYEFSKTEEGMKLRNKITKEANNE